jgi:hypothetical protein
VPIASVSVAVRPFASKVALRWLPVLSVTVVAVTFPLPSSVYENVYVMPLARAWVWTLPLASYVLVR